MLGVLWAQLSSNLVLTVYWVQRIGAVGVILGTIVSCLVVLAIPMTWQALRVFRQPSASGGAAK
jgi:hypothetical protein